jgi:Ca2+-binding EF-hand superfamily protein
MKIVAKSLPVEEIDNYTQMFHTMDKDKDGSLTLEELKEGLRINGHSVPETEIQMLLEAVSAYCMQFNITIFSLLSCEKDSYDYCDSGN